MLSMNNNNQAHRLEPTDERIDLNPIKAHRSAREAVPFEEFSGI